MKKSVNITFSALFAALICILSQICFITPTVPLTLQILGVALCGFVLPLKWALGSVLTYIAVGALGLPVFSAFKGGFQMLIGPTGGFLLGFILLTAGCGLAVKCNNGLLRVLICVLGIALCHTIGIVQYSITTGIGIIATFLTASLPFLFKDAILVFAAYFLSKFVKKRLEALKT
ncbi:MAG: biotin transporter BioY [Clostridia bacterium]|nr:biotin transporter BioY [Clostridia bacterium]